MPRGKKANDSAAHRVTVYLTADQHKQLKLYAVNHETEMTAVIVELLRKAGIVK